MRYLINNEEYHEFYRYGSCMVYLSSYIARLVHQYSDGKENHGIFDKNTRDRVFRACVSLANLWQDFKKKENKIKNEIDVAEGYRGLLILAELPVKSRKVFFNTAAHFIISHCECCYIHE
jgi:hypothetical protein